MSGTFEAFGEDPGRGSGRGSAVRVVLLTVAACFLVWVVFLRDGEPSAPAITVAAVDSVADEDGSFPHTCEGAVAAYTAYYRELNTAKVSLNPEKTLAFVNAVYTGAALDGMRQAGLPELRRYAEGAIGDQYRAGVQTIYQGTPIGWRVNSCGKDKVEVQLWTLGIRANATNVWPMQIWNTQIAEMIWKDHAWKINDGHIEDGPIPYWTQNPLESRPKNMRDVMKRTRGMRAFVVAMPNEKPSK